MGEEGVTLGWGWAWARRPPQSLPQGDARSPRPQGQEATDKYIRDPAFPLLPTPTTWRGGFGDPENKDQAAGQAGEASRADATRRRPAAAVTAFASGQATDWTQPLARGSWPTPPWTPVSLGCPSQTQSSKQTPSPAALSIPQSPHTSLGPAAKTRPLPHNEGRQMDARMDRVTGFQHLQKADSQAPMPGVPRQ